MAAIRSRGNKATELKLARILRTAGITGWRRHQPLLGHPDFIFRRERVALFVDGCFWHGCAKHSRTPRSNQRYWRAKIARNMARDRSVRRELQQRNWTAIRFWEHDLTSPHRVIRKLVRVLGIFIKSTSSA